MCSRRWGRDAGVAGRPPAAPPATPPHASTTPCPFSPNPYPHSNPLRTITWTALATLRSSEKWAQTSRRGRKEGGLDGTGRARPPSAHATQRRRTSPLTPQHQPYIPPTPPPQDNKCSWLVVQALQRASPAQRAVIEVRPGPGCGGVGLGCGGMGPGLEMGSEAGKAPGRSGEGMGLSAQAQEVGARTRAVGARQHRTLTPTLTLPPCQPHPQANYGKEDAAAVAAVKGVYRDLELEAVFRRQGVERVEALGFLRG